MASLMAASISSCRQGGLKHMHEGEIFYTIRYVKNPSSLPVEFLPRELVISFNDDRIYSNLRAPFGNSGISSVTNPKEKIYDTYLNMLSFKYCYEGNGNEIQPGFSAMDGITFRETGRESEICGFTCREVETRIPGSDSVRFIWYTDEIRATGANLLTPYREIDGILMEFFYIIGEAELEFTADEVFVKEIPDKNFERRTNYKKVPRSYLDSMIRKMIAY
jgi:hypothetical protein